MKNNVSLNIDGMSCTACASSIERKLISLDGVEHATVNFASEKANIEYDAENIDLQTMIKAIKDLGYDAKLPQVADITKLKVDGMSCATCAVNIEKSINSMPGVQKASVNFSNETVSLSYDKKALSLDEIKKQVESLGYNLIDETDMDEDDAKVNRAKQKMFASVLLSGIVMLLMIVHMFIHPVPGYLIIIAILAFVNIFIIGRKVHQSSIMSIRNKSANMDVLVSLGSVPPYTIGLLALFFPLQSFIEMATAIMSFHLIGKYLETRAKGRASQAIKKLIKLGAKTARIIADGEEREVAVENLRIGDIMIVRPGEKIPTDGIVTEGRSMVDESMATGESMPVLREEGSEVIGATINKEGLLKVRVTKIGKDTFLAQVIKLVEECQGSKVPIQEFADRITSYFVPAIILITILTFTSFLVFPEFHLRIISWGATFLPWVNPELPPLTLAFITATAVLVIACPCALGLGTPTALMVGSGIGAENGVLFRSGESIQTLREIDLIAFDKTGTITKGNPEVTDIIPINSDENDVLYFAASVEHASEHSLSWAVMEKAKERSVKLSAVRNFSALVGMGIKGEIDGQTVIVGSRKCMENFGIGYQEIEDNLERLENEAKTVIMVAKDDAVIGIIAIADPIKADSVSAINGLKELGINTAMITGDNSRTAKAIADQVGISEVISEVMPDEKVEAVRKLQKHYKSVAMVGDGINDAPALKQANVGIALGTGTDIAIESADVTLVRGELSSVLLAIKLSKATFRKIKENFFWAWFYNAVAIPVAMMGLLHPMIGAAAMSFSSLNVVYNSLRLKKNKAFAQS